MKLRVAKPSDAAVLARIHIECGKIQVGSFMHRLGPWFLKTYYKLFLGEKGCVILIAEDSDGTPLGFSSGSLNAREHIENLRRNRMRLAFSMIPALMARPRLLKDVLQRERFVSSAGESASMVVTDGARGEYWAWRPNSKQPAAAVILRRAWCNVLFELGCRSFQYELDSLNSDVEKFQQTFGCTIVRKITLPDGRSRVVMQEPVGPAKKVRRSPPAA
jgi:hypothetical protein